MVSSKAKRKGRLPSRKAAAESDVEVEVDEASAPAAPPSERPSVGASKRGRFDSVLIIVALVYLLTVWFDGIGTSIAQKTTPRVWLYFSQIAALFKNAGLVAIDYRAEGWSCESRRWVEVDVRPWFLIDSDNKEIRFHRTLQFYRKERKVMRALEDYVVRRSNESTSRPPIGGVRFLSLRIPYPKLGEHVDRAVHKPLSEYPAEMRHNWYYTPASRRKERCGDRTPIGKDDDDRGAPAEEPRDKNPKDKDPEP